MIVIILLALAAAAVGALLVKVSNLRKEAGRIAQKAVLDLHTGLDGRCLVRIEKWGQCPYCLLEYQERKFQQRYDGIVEDSYEEVRLERLTSEYEQAYVDTYAIDWQFQQMLS